MTLTVLSVGYPLAPVGPDAVGGSEQVLTALDGALVEAGHRSLVVACEGSEAAGTLLSYPAPAHPIDAEVHRRSQGWVRDRVAAALGSYAVDLVHMHGLDFHACLPAEGVPVLATLHLPADWYPREALWPSRRGTWIHGVSHSQGAHLPDAPHVLPPIANGVPVERLGAIHPRKCSYALMLARVCPEKGLHLALRAAHEADATLLIAGEIFPYPAHQAYFAQEVEPLLDKRRRYLGPVGFAQKRRLLAAARCLVVPSLVDETSSLVAMEAASTGTPVIALRRGALPEVVEHGRSGFVVDDVAGLAGAMRRVRELDPAVCREVARRRFSHSRMAAEYIARYSALVREPELAPA